MTTAEMIAVLQAFERGKVIEWRAAGYLERKWHDGSNSGTGPLWNFNFFDYRVRPKPREWWVNEYESGCLGEMHDSKHLAEDCAGTTRVRCVHVREVLDDPEEE